VGHMVTVDDVVIPVSLTRYESSALKSESTLPATGFGGSLVFGEWELTSVVVPATEHVDGLNTGGSAERERQLKSRHFD
jgi:hypothetical protein